MIEQFWAEDKIDEWLAYSGLLPESGIFADVGCAHPWRYSMTAFLRERGWTGICIDGNPDYAPEWEGIANATFVQAVLSDKPWVNFLNEKTNSLVSRIHELGQGVPAFKLRKVLETYGFPKIDFLAADIESSEVPVIREFLDATPHEKLPSIMVIEYNSCHQGRDVGVFNLLSDYPSYRLVHMTDSNAVFHKV